MLLASLPQVLFDAIVERLNLRERRMLTSSSKKLANEVWGRLPAVRVRYSLKDAAQTLKMFWKVRSVQPDDVLVRKVTKIAQNPYRMAALRNWINKQCVCIDAGGFYTPNQGYPATDKKRIRIGLWDRPLGFRQEYAHFATNYWTERVPFLVRKFVEMGYDP
jgi:hypothetical protein